MPRNTPEAFTNGLPAYTRVFFSLHTKHLNLMERGKGGGASVSTLEYPRLSRSRLWTRPCQVPLTLNSEAYAGYREGHHGRRVPTSRLRRGDGRLTTISNAVCRALFACMRSRGIAEDKIDDPAFQYRLPCLSYRLPSRPVPSSSGTGMGLPLVVQAIFPPPLPFAPPPWASFHLYCGSSLHSRQRQAV